MAVQSLRLDVQLLDDARVNFQKPPPSSEFLWGGIGGGRWLKRLALWGGR